MTNKGARWERKYRKVLNTSADDGDETPPPLDGDVGPAALAPYTAVRMPSSGSGTKQDLPDLHIWANFVPWGGDRMQYAVECKAFEDRTWLSKREVLALRSHAESTGAVPLIFCHGDYVGDRVFSVDELTQTDEGYTVSVQRDFDDARTLKDWILDPKPLKDWITGRPDV